MFEMCEERCYLKADRERVVKLMMSFNEPMVAPPRHHVQPTHAYICTFKEDEGLSVYVYLHLTTEKVGILYRHSDVFSTHEECRDAEDEAVQFAEDMGFLMDDLKFELLDSAQQAKLIATIPTFISPAAAVEKEIPAEEKTAVAKPTVEEVVKPAEPVVEKPVARKKGEEDKPVVKIVAEERVEEKKIVEKEEKTWEPEVFLSKFRMRAAAERMKKGVK